MHEGGGDLEPTNQSGWQGCHESNDAELAGIRWDAALPLDPNASLLPRKATDRKRIQRQKHRCDEFLAFSDEAVS
jgi:hypothetical protein